MKEVLLMYARYTKRANADAFALLDALSEEAMNADRKSYYGSLASLAAHIAGATLYFQSLFRASCPAAAQALKATESLKTPHDSHVTPDEWRQLKDIAAASDQATIDLVEALSDKDLACPVKLDWYDGKPGTVPLCFLAHQLSTHGTHHRGQISQILDELGIEHDFSGIDLEFLPKQPEQ